jgi:hypothetical protein
MTDVRIKAVCSPSYGGWRVAQSNGFCIARLSVAQAVGTVIVRKLVTGLCRSLTHSPWMMISSR